MIFQGLFIDGFAGGGGASTGIAQAIGREVDIAINHSETAIAIHKANHPATEHFCQDIRAIWPRAATRLRPVAGAWFSPDCKEYSKAKGGPLKDRHIRALSDEVENWLKEVEPRVAYLENVEEYVTAGPLDEDGREIKELRGKPFKLRVRRWRRLGYRVQWWILKACDYGAPTSRRRLYVVMRRDGLPIVRPAPTHGPADHPKVKAGKLQPYLTAADCMDWTKRAPSIFDRMKPYADATNRRVAHGVVRYVIEAAAKGTIYFVPGSEPLRAPHVTKFHATNIGSPMPAPLPTITANGASARQAGAVPLGMVEAELREVPFIDRQFGRSAPDSVKEPVAATATRNKTAAVGAFLTRFYGSDKRGAGGSPQQPLAVTRASGQHHAIVAAHIEQANTGMVGHTPRKPLSTIVGKGCTQRIIETTLIEADALPPAMLDRAVKVAAFLVKYYGTDGESEASQIQPVDRPIDTITTKARFAVVTVTIDATTYVIVDIGLRMLTPRELARAQGFPDTYVLDPECWYTTDTGRRKFGRLPVSYQISAIGNSVCPPVARALVIANQPGIADVRLAA